MADTTTTVKKLMESEASQYESERGHGFSTAEEEAAWRTDITDALRIKPGASCLDVGAGTGVLTRLLAEWVGSNGHVVANDLSDKMLSLNEELLPLNLRERVTFLKGDIHDAAVSQQACHHSFDYIACRQVVCMLADPIAIFKQWNDLLSPNGRVVILDALWTRRSWSGEWSELIDQFPLACVQSLATVPYCLQQAGFIVEKNQFLSRVNRWFEKTDNAEFDCPRYIVVAKKVSQHKD